MLEKIGLPAKPSIRGRTWVLDASHCQGCSSQFTFFNRKHHCRRCGGLFCNSCTLQRMYLRGQGDQPVRICNPCKDLEEAARFAARQGRKNQAPKGGSRTSAKSDDEVIQHILGTDGKPESSADINSTGDDHSSAAADASNSMLQEGDDSNQSGKFELSESSSRDGTIHDNVEKDSSTPEELRQQAQEEKKKYHVLKKEGKSEEALQAFKRGKEIERCAEALELSLRKSRRKAGSFTVGTMELNQEELGDPERKALDISKDGEELDLAIEVQKRKSTIRGKDKIDDISSELKELGWSDADLQDVDRKPSKMTLDGELSSLIRESHNSKANSPGIEFASSIDRTQVLAHKRRALALKREGKLGEAKEELKKAKILEKQLEEQEMIGQDVESDDELAALVRGLDSESKGEAHPLGGLGVKFGEESIFDPSHITTMAGEFDDNLGIDVTDDDINDPEIAAALRSMGWQEEDSEQPLSVPGASLYFENSTRSSTQSLVDAKSNSYHDRAALQQEVLSLKREALALKRAGNVAEAMEQLRQAKMLEKELQNITSQHSVHDTDLKYDVSNHVDPRIPGSGNVGKKSHLAETNVSLMNLHDEDGESIEVTDEDMGDPELVKVLKDVGWQEAEQESVPRKKSETVLSGQNSSVTSPLKTKTELQKELLGIKRKALSLRRDGRIDEADAELNRGKLLEKQLEETEALQKTKSTQASILYNNSKPSRKDRGSDFRVSSLIEEEDDKLIEVTEEDMVDPELFKQLNGLGWQEADQVGVSRNSENQNILSAQSGNKSSSASPFQMSKSKAELQKELLRLKRKALALRREGRLEEADAELSKGKFLENQLEDIETLQKSHNTQASILQDNSKPSQKGRVSDSISLSFKVDEDAGRVKKQDMHDPSMLAALRSTNWRNDSDNVPEAFTDPSNARGLKTLENKRTSITGKYDDIQDTFLPNNVKGEPNKNISSEKQPPNVIDLLTGDTWKAPPLERVENLVNNRDNEPVNDAIPSTSDISIGTTSISKVQVKVNSGSGGNPEQNIQHASAEEKAKSVMLNASDVSSMTNTTKCNAETTEISASSIAPQIQDLQQEILSHKRKALALKREGKLAEAKEELHLAKLLQRERELEGNSGSQVSSSSPSPSPSHTVNASEQIIKPLEEAIPTVESSQTPMKFVPALFSDSTRVSSSGSEADVSLKKQQIHKQTPTKDRLKLQRESLAHKRRALALRREGKVEEAEAEFELAKSLESQMDELAGNNSQVHHSTVGIGSDDGSLVDNILDPHLLSALKGIGWKESDIFSQVPTKGLDAKNKGHESISNSVRSNFGNEAPQVNVQQTLGLKEERSHLEEKIKAEKLRALNLKRAGKQAEALDALRGAKQLEKKLQSLAA
ncbi:uncharacterized protein LOC131070726 isoform X2 [Cryptomeria japonica]|uniref:uncharacterized protein LOC131070726 isoform X2 n=1 Tax=Cryptomeria japonica TaxID=3369 RepID=UPI0025AD948E|nr:uncharacterized protein LOC131070726 isoform X2 [Cryptomeria japonica]